MKIERIIWAGGVLIALLCGHFIGNNDRSNRDSETQSGRDHVSSSVQAIPAYNNAANSSNDPAVRRLAATIDTGAANLGKSSDYYAMRASFAKLAAIDPLAAIAKADELPNELKRFYRYHEIFAVWAETDPEAALAFIKENPIKNGSRYDRRLAGLVAGLANSDPARAFEIAVANNPSTSERYRLYDSLFTSMVDNGQMTTAAASLAGLGNDHDDQHTAYRAFAWAWAQTDPKAAANWIETLDKQQATSAAGGLLKFWPEHDPVGAATYAMDHQNGGYKLNTVIRYWAKNDIQAASEWLLQHEPSPALDEAVETLAEQTMEFDPEAALGWAESITDDDERERLLRKIEKKRKELEESGTLGALFEAEGASPTFQQTNDLSDGPSIPSITF